MIFKKDMNPAQRAYDEGQRMSRENEANRRITEKAAFKVVMQVHLETCYRKFYNRGKWQGDFCHGKVKWNETVWTFHHFAWAGFKRVPGIGEFMKPAQDGRPVLALSYWDFEELMAGWKGFTEVPFSMSLQVILLDQLQIIIQ